MMMRLLMMVGSTCTFVFQSSTTLAWTLRTGSFRIKSRENRQSSIRGLFGTSSTTIEDQPLQLYDSKTRSKQVFTPVRANRDEGSVDKDATVTMYTCGPTVYDFAHIGNFRAFLTYDLVKRVLLYLGYKNIHHICNITDVDDKILVRANEQGLAVGCIQELTLKFEEAFLQDLEALNCLPATAYPRATDHVPAMIRFVQDLSVKGLAYETEDGSWYFDSQKQSGYGQQLVNLNYEEMVQQKETENSEGKKHFADFCVWKAFKTGVDRMDAAWESALYAKKVASADEKTQPWPLNEPVIKLGRPGWHLECSAMARTFFQDETMDLHGGGVDLKFPHHENEIAQSQAWSEKNYCNCWFHNGFVNMGDEKMSKSLGNFLTLADVCPTSFDVRAYRYMVISSQYRNALNFTKKAMQDAKKLIKRIDNVKSNIQSAVGDDVQAGAKPSTMAEKVIPSALDSFEVAIRDDLSMPRAAATLISVVKAVEQEFKRSADNPDHVIDTVGLQAASAAIDKMDEVFGILYDVPASTGNRKVEDEEITSVPDEVMDLVDQRSLAKQTKDWELADSLRERITELGFVIKDVKGGDPIVTPVDV